MGKMQSCAFSFFHMLLDQGRSSVSMKLRVKVAHQLTLLALALSFSTRITPWSHNTHVLSDLCTDDLYWWELVQLTPQCWLLTFSTSFHQEISLIRWNSAQSLSLLPIRKLYYVQKKKDNKYATSSICPLELWVVSYYTIRLNTLTCAE